jgi:N-acetylglucosamine-6-phosphate deacetylase
VNRTGASLTWSNARLVRPDRVVEGGWVRVEGGRIAALGSASDPVPGGDVRDLGGRYVTPGYIDIHTHGGGGASFTTGDQEEARTAAAFHLAHGTTTCVASLVTAPVADLARMTDALGELVGDGLLAGVHLEGPFLSAKRCGAQDPEYLRPPDPAALAVMLRSPHVLMVTLAPELDGALDAVKRVVGAGVVAAVGHTDASYAETTAAIDAGATVATHLFNGMRGLHHRDPGPVGAALNDERVTVELINDGIHLHPAIVAMAVRAARGGFTLVTDAMAAAGMGDGDYRLGSMEVRVSGGVARLAAGDSIAGSTLTMENAVRNAVHASGLSVPDAVAAATVTPARVLGLDDRGALRPGLRADLLVLDDDLAVAEVVRGGRPA